MPLVFSIHPEAVSEQHFLRRDEICRSDPLPLILLCVVAFEFIPYFHISIYHSRPLIQQCRTDALLGGPWLVSALACGVICGGFLKAG
jgi:hypothetical protein